MRRSFFPVYRKYMLTEQIQSLGSVSRWRAQVDTVAHSSWWSKIMQSVESLRTQRPHTETPHSDLSETPHSDLSETPHSDLSETPHSDLSVEECLRFFSTSRKYLTTGLSFAKCLRFCFWCFFSPPQVNTKRLLQLPKPTLTHARTRRSLVGVDITIASRQSSEDVRPQILLQGGRGT